MHRVIYSCKSRVKENIYIKKRFAPCTYTFYHLLTLLLTLKAHYNSWPCYSLNFISLNSPSQATWTIKRVHLELPSYSHIFYAAKLLPGHLDKMQLLINLFWDSVSNSTFLTCSPVICCWPRVHTSTVEVPEFPTLCAFDLSLDKTCLTPI